MADWTKSQLDERARLDYEMAEHAFAELAASVSDPRQAPVISLDDIEQVDGSAKACLKYLRVEPGDVPDSVDDPDDRIDWLCRPSGAMHRRVRLDDGWYRQAFGPIPSRLDTGEAVALLPRGVRGYRYIDPGTGRTVQVTAETARRISPMAVAFYKPLPPRPLTVRDLIAFIFGAFDRNDYLHVFVAALATTVMGLFLPWANSVAFGIVVPSGQAELVARQSLDVSGGMAQRTERPVCGGLY